MVAVAAGNKTNGAGILVADVAVVNLGSTVAILAIVLAAEEILKIDLTIFNNFELYF